MCTVIHSASPRDTLRKRAIVYTQVAGHHLYGQPIHGDEFLRRRPTKSKPLSPPLDPPRCRRTKSAWRSCAISGRWNICTVIYSSTFAELSATFLQPSMVSIQVSCRYWDRWPVHGADFLKRSPNKSTAGHVTTPKLSQTSTHEICSD